MGKLKMCQGCNLVKHEDVQYSCDKCMVKFALYDIRNQLNTQLAAIEEKWVNHG
jgi:uncharacterized paraquat-inducible protein A